MLFLEQQDIQTIAELDLEWNRLKEKTLFISGGTGFIGSFLIEVLLYRNKKYNNKIKIIACSRSKSGEFGDVTYIKHDIIKPLTISVHIDYILHLASNTHPKQYSRDPVGTITTNVFGTFNLLELANKHKARFLLASSVEIYGEGNGIPIDENYCGTINCNSARAGYNEAKRVSESLCQSYISQYGVDCVIARLSRVFGADKKEDSKAMSQFIKCAVNKQNIVLKSLGKQKFSFIYVADAVSGLIKILLDGNVGEAYNIAADCEDKTLGDYAKFIADTVGTNVIFDLVGEEGSSNASYAIINCDKLKRIGWAPQYTVMDGLRQTINIFYERM